MSIYVTNEQHRGAFFFSIYSSYNIFILHSLNVHLLIMISFENGRPIRFACDFFSLITWVFLLRSLDYDFTSIQSCRLSTIYKLPLLAIQNRIHLKCVSVCVCARQCTKQRKIVFFSFFRIKKKLVINLYVFSIGFVSFFFVFFGQGFIFFLLFFSVSKFIRIEMVLMELMHTKKKKGKNGR